MLIVPFADFKRIYYLCRYLKSKKVINSINLWNLKNIFVSVNDYIAQLFKDYVGSTLFQLDFTQFVNNKNFR